MIGKKTTTKDINLTMETLNDIRYEEDILNLDRNSAQKFRKKLSKEKRFNLTLISACALFLIAEFPHSILLFISIFSDEFYMNVYRRLGDLLDIVALTSHSLNFSLYCSMSKEFRNSLFSVFNFRKKRPM